VLIVVRHGRTAANAAGLLLGRQDPPLDPVGIEQAGRLAAEVGLADRIVSSPLRRARETAAAFGAGIEIEIDERWVELDYGEFDGVPVAQLGEATWARWRSEPDFAPPGGESLVALTARVHDACEALRDDAREGTVVVVSHVSPIKAALAWALGVGPEVAWRSHLDPASITRISIGRAGPALRTFNEVAHLR
jgi:broad specificity phosphatase PhoE